ncbi:MAG: hypothetical protein EOM59_06535 [Clostridia bacterium]|nr:hypothetical protein [Clostridia bacterium]
MNALLLIACISMIAGAFILFDISFSELSNFLFQRFLSRPKSLRDEINEMRNKKKRSFLRRELSEVQDILKTIGKESRFPALCTASLILLSIGASVAILMGNMFLVPVMAAGCGLLPFWYIRLSQSGYKKDLAAELETALSVITSAYLRTEDIHTAVEESLQYVNPPAHQVFKSFLLRIELIDPDIDGAIIELKMKIDNEVFREWCDGLLACQYDRSLKTTLTPIVNKLSDMRIVNGELENLVFEPRKEFITMVLLVVGNIPLIYCLNKSWYDTLMHSVVGQFVLALCAVAIFISTAFVIRLTQPIEYRR